jgi:uncharacterized protein YggE
MGNLFLTLLVLPIAAAVSANPLPKAPHIYVEGHAETRVQPDRFSIQASISEIDTSASSASASVETRLAKLIDEAERIGVRADQVKAFELEIGPEYEWKEGGRVLLGTRVSRQVEFTLHDVQRAQELVQAIVDADAAAIQSSRAFSSRERELQSAMMKRAIENARERATAIAKTTGGELGPVYAVSDFKEYDQPRSYSAPQFAALSMVSDGRAVQLSPGLVEIQRSAYVVFLLED